MSKGQAKGTYGRRILKTVHKNGKEYQYHATKGWRVYRGTK